MTQLLKLYKKTISKEEKKPVQSFINDGYTVRIFRPTIFKLTILKHEIDWQVRIKGFLLYFTTMGRYRILYVMEGNKVLHYSYIIPRNFRFPFMGSNELEIGPCFTDVQYRGRGIYTKVMQIIPHLFKDKARTFCAFTAPSNFYAQRAIEKAGYNYCGLLRVTSILKILKLAPKTPKV